MIREFIENIVSSQGGVPLHSQSLERSRRFLEEYGAWLDGSESGRQRKLIKEAFYSYPGLVSGVDLTRLESRYGNGLVIEGLEGILKQEWYFILDYVAGKMEKESYVRMISDIRYFNRKEHVESIDRYYFKPNIEYDDSQRRIQRYGNILLTVNSVNDEPQELKIQGSVYHGYQYLPPDPFHELVEKFFEE